MGFYSPPDNTWSRSFKHSSSKSLAWWYETDNTEGFWTSLLISIVEPLPSNQKFCATKLTYYGFHPLVLHFQTRFLSISSNANSMPLRVSHSNTNLSEFTSKLKAFQSWLFCLLNFTTPLQIFLSIHCNNKKQNGEN